MNRSGNIGAAKNMDTVFADFTDDELEQDLIFDEDDQLVEVVEGYTEEGHTIFEEDEEIFKIAHQIEDENKDKPEEVKKETEKLLGPDNDTDQNIKDIEDVKKEEIDDSQTMDELKKNGESEADKELGLDKLEDEYHSSATVEEAYNKWLLEQPYDYDKENEAEGTDDELGKDIDNSLPTEEPKAEEDENYNATADASVKEEYEYDKKDEAEGTDDKFGKKIDNSEPTEDVKPEGDPEYNATNDATVKEAAEGEEQKCECGKDDCPICNPKKEDLAPEGAPTEDKVAEDERHEESEGETVAPADGEAVTPNNVDDNTLPKPEEMTPDCSPETDNGDITDDSEKQDEKKEAEATPAEEEKKEEAEVDAVEEAFTKWLHEEDITLPLNNGETPILPEDVKKEEEELEKAAPKSDAKIKTESEEMAAEGTEDTMPEADATVPEDEACGKGSGCKESANVEESFAAWLGIKEEAEEVEAPTATDVEDAAKTEVEDTETELDDDLAAVADDESDDEDVDLEYDPSDEELIDIANGEEIEEKASFK